MVALIAGSARLLHGNQDRGVATLERARYLADGFEPPAISFRRPPPMPTSAISPERTHATGAPSPSSGRRESRGRPAAGSRAAGRTRRVPRAVRVRHCQPSRGHAARRRDRPGDQHELTAGHAYPCRGTPGPRDRVPCARGRGDRGGDRPRARASRRTALYGLVVVGLASVGPRTHSTISPRSSIPARTWRTRWSRCSAPPISSRPLCARGGPRSPSRSWRTTRAGRSGSPRPRRPSPPPGCGRCSPTARRLGSWSRCRWCGTTLTGPSETSRER